MSTFGYSNDALQKPGAIACSHMVCGCSFCFPRATKSAQSEPRLQCNPFVDETMGVFAKP